MSNDLVNSPETLIPQEIHKVLEGITGVGELHDKTLKMLNERMNASRLSTEQREAVRIVLQRQLPPNIRTSVCIVLNRNNQVECIRLRYPQIGAPVQTSFGESITTSTFSNTVGNFQNSFGYSAERSASGVNQNPNNRPPAWTAKNINERVQILMGRVPAGVNGGAINSGCTAMDLLALSMASNQQEAIRRLSVARKRLGGGNHSDEAVVKSLNNNERREVIACQLRGSFFELVGRALQQMSEMVQECDIVIAECRKSGMNIAPLEAARQLAARHMSDVAVAAAALGEHQIMWVQQYRAGPASFQKWLKAEGSNWRMRENTLIYHLWDLLRCETGIYRNDHRVPPAYAALLDHEQSRYNQLFQAASKGNSTPVEQLQTQGAGIITRLAQWTQRANTYHVRMTALTMTRHHMLQAAQGDANLSPTEIATDNQELELLRKFMADQSRNSLGNLNEHLRLVRSGVTGGGVDLLAEDFWNRHGRRGLDQAMHMLTSIITAPIPTATARAAVTSTIQTAFPPLLGWPRDAQGREIPYDQLTDPQRKELQPKLDSMLQAIRDFNTTGAMSAFQDSINVMLHIRAHVNPESVLTIMQDGPTKQDEEFIARTKKAHPQLNAKTVAALLQENAGNTRNRAIIALIALEQFETSSEIYHKHYQELLERLHKILGVHLALAWQPPWVTIAAVAGTFWLIGGAGGLRSLPGAWGRVFGLEPFANTGMGLTGGYGYVGRGLANAPGRVWNGAFSAGQRLYYLATGNVRLALNPAGEVAGGAARQVSEILTDARGLRNGFRTEILALRVGANNTQRLLSMQTGAQSLFAELATLEEELRRAGGSVTQINELKAIRLRWMTEYLLEIRTLVSGGRAQHIDALLALIGPGNRARQTILNALWEAHLVSDIKEKIDILVKAGVPVDVARGLAPFLMDSGVLGRQIQTGVSPAMVRRMAEAMGIAVGESAYLRQLLVLGSDAERAIVIRFCGRSGNLATEFGLLSPANARKFAIFLANANPVQEARLVVFISQGRNIGAFLRLVDESSHIALAILELQPQRMAAVLELCESSLHVRAGLAALRGGELSQAIIRLGSASSEFRAAIRFLTAAEAERFLAMFSRLNAAQAAQLVEEFSRLTNHAARIRFLKALSVESRWAVAGRWGGRIAGGAAILFETYMWLESERALGENRGRSNNVICLLRETLTPARNFREEIRNGQTVFVHTTNVTRDGRTEPLCIVNASELQARTEAAVGMDVARTYSNLAGVAGAAVIFIPYVGIPLSAIIMVSNFVYQQGLRREEGEHWERICRDLPPELLVLLPLDRIRQSQVYQDRGPYAPFLSIRNAMVKRIIEQMEASDRARLLKACGGVIGATFSSLDELFNRAFGNGEQAGKTAAAIHQVIQNDTALRQALLKGIDEERARMEIPLAAAIFQPLYQEIMRMAPPNFLAEYGQNVIQSVWADRRLLLDCMFRFLPELGWFRMVFGNEDIAEFNEATRRTAIYYTRHKLLQVYEGNRTRLANSDKAREALLKGLEPALKGTAAVDRNRLEFPTTLSQILQSLRTAPLSAQTGWIVLANPAPLPEPEEKAAKAKMQQEQKEKRMSAFDYGRPRTTGIVEALEQLDLQTEIGPLLQAVGDLPAEQGAHFVRALQAIPDITVRIRVLRTFAVNQASRKAIIELCEQASKAGILTLAQNSQLQVLNESIGNSAPGGWQFTIRETIARRALGLPPDGLALPRWNAGQGKWEIPFTQQEASKSRDAEWISPEDRYRDLDMSGGLLLRELGAELVRVGLSADGRTRVVVTENQPGVQAYVLRNGGMTAFFMFNEGRWYRSTDTNPAWTSVVGTAFLGQEAAKKNPAAALLIRANDLLSRQQATVELPLPQALAVHVERGGKAFMDMFNVETEEIDGHTRYIIDGGTPNKTYFACIGGRWHTSTPANPLWVRCAKIGLARAEGAARRSPAIQHELRLIEERFDPNIAFRRVLEQIGAKQAKVRAGEHERRQVHDGATMRPSRPGVLEVDFPNWYRQLPSPENMPGVPIYDRYNWVTFEFRMDENGVWQTRLSDATDYRILANPTDGARLASRGGGGMIARGLAFFNEPLLEWQPVDQMLQYLGATNPFEIMGMQFYARGVSLNFTGARPALADLVNQRRGIEQNMRKEGETYSPFRDIAIDLLDRQVRNSESYYLNGFPRPEIQRQLFGGSPLAPAVISYGDALRVNTNENYLPALQAIVEPYQKGLEESMKQHEAGEGLYNSAPQAVFVREFSIERNGINYDVLVVDIMRGTLSNGSITGFERGIAVRTSGGPFIPLPRGTTGTHFNPAFSEWNKQIRSEQEAVMKQRSDTQRKGQIESLNKELGFEGRVYCAMFSTAPVPVDYQDGITTYAMRDGNDVVIVRVDDRGGSVTGVLVLQDAARTTTNMKEMRENVYKESLEKIRKEYTDSTWKWMQDNPEEWKYIQARAKKAAEDEIRNYEHQWANLPDTPRNSNVFPLTPTERSRVQTLGKAFEKMRKENNGDLLRPYDYSQPNPAVQSILRRVLNRAPAETMNDFMNNVLGVRVRCPSFFNNQGLDFENGQGGLSVSMLVLADQNQITSEQVRKRFQEEYTQWLKRQQEQEKKGAAGVLHGQQAEKESVAAGGDTLYQRGVFRTAVLMVLGRDQGLHAIDHEIHLDSFLLRVRGNLEQHDKRAW